MIASGAGNDYVCAGAGDDIVLTGSGADEVIGGMGADVIVTGSGDDNADVDPADVLCDLGSGNNAGCVSGVDPLLFSEAGRGPGGAIVGDALTEAFTMLGDESTAVIMRLRDDLGITGGLVGATLDLVVVLISAVVVFGVGVAGALAQALQDPGDALSQAVAELLDLVDMA